MCMRRNVWLHPNILFITRRLVLYDVYKDLALGLGPYKGHISLAGVL